MKKVKMLLIMAFFAMMVVCVPDKVQAKTISIEEDKDVLYDRNGYYYDLEFPVDSIMEIKFYDDTYGYLYYKLEDSDGNIILDEETFIGYEEYSVKKTVPAGKYRFTIRENHDWELEYHFEIMLDTLQDIPATYMSLERTKTTLAVGKSVWLNPYVEPIDTTDEVTFKSSNKNVATVTKDGKITAKHLGVATITATCGKITKKCVVTVNSQSLSVVKGKTKNMSSYAKYISGLNKKTWKSSKKSIATVSTKGVVTMKKYGTTTLSVKDSKKRTYKITFKVIKPVTVSVDYISDTSIYNEVGIKFKNNTNKKITYMTLNITQYDNRGHKLKSPYSYYYVNDSLGAKKSDVWEFWVNDDTKKVKVSMKKVWFSDGTTWKP